MATTACKWTQVSGAKVPAALFLTGEDGVVTVDKNYVVDAGVALADGSVPLGDQSLMLQALRTDYLATGEDQADFDAELEQADLYFGNTGGKLYGIARMTSGYWIYVRECGLMAYLPYALGGGILLGVTGFALGYKGKDIGKAALYAAVGVLAGGGLGYGAARLMTDRTTKAYQQMGLVNVRSTNSLKQVHRVGMLDAHRVGFTQVPRARYDCRNMTCPPGLAAGYNPNTGHCGCLMVVGGRGR